MLIFCNFHAFLGVNFGLKDLICVKKLTFRNSAFVTKDGNHDVLMIKMSDTGPGWKEGETNG